MKQLEDWEKERAEGIEEYTKIFDDFLKIINNEAISKEKELLKVNPEIVSFLSNLSFKNMINFYNEFQPEIVLKILYIFELYKNIIKINSTKNTVLSDLNLEKKEKDELYNELSIDKQNNIIELKNFENSKKKNFEQAKPYLDTAIRNIYLDLELNPNKKYGHEDLYDIIEENKKNLLSPSSSSSSSSSPPPPMISKSGSDLEIINNIVGEIVSKTFPLPPPPPILMISKSGSDLEIINDIVGEIVLSKAVLIIKPLKNTINPLKNTIKEPLKNTIKDSENKAIDFHQGTANDNMKYALFGKIPKYTEFFEYKTSITSTKFKDVTSGKKYDYIWFAGPIFIDDIFNPKTDSIEILKNLLKKDGRVIFTIPTKNKNNNTIKVQDLYRDILKPKKYIEDINELKTIFNQNFDYIKNGGYRMYKLKDNIYTTKSLNKEIIEGVIGKLLEGKSSTPTPTPTPTPIIDSDKLLINGIIGKLLEGTTSPSTSTPSSTPSSSMLPRVSFFSNLSSLPSVIGNSITSLLTNIFDKTKKLIKLTTYVTSGAVVVGVGAATLIAAISLGTLLALGYIGLFESINLIQKLQGYNAVPIDEMKTILNNVISAKRGNNESKEKLLEYVVYGASSAALIPLGLAIGALYGLGLIGTTMLRQTVSKVIRKKNRIDTSKSKDKDDDDDTIESIDSNRKSIDKENEMDKLSNSILNDNIELVESLKKHHIIDKILDEPIMYSEYNQEGPNLVADIKIIRDDSEEGIDESVQSIIEETKVSDSSIEKLLSNNENNYHSEIINRILTEPKPVINQSVENVNVNDNDNDNNFDINKGHTL